MKKQGMLLNKHDDQFAARAAKQVHGKYVCAMCIDDRFLRDLVQQNRHAHECNYCGTRSDSEKIAAPLGKVVKKIAVLFEKRTTRPTDDSPTPPRKDGRRSADDPASTIAVMQGYRWTSNEGLLSYVASTLERASGWHWWLELPETDLMDTTSGELLDWSWLKFADVVTYESRFNFLTAPEPYVEGMLGIRDLLHSVGELVKDRKLIRALPAGEKVYRARIRMPTDMWNPNESKEMNAPPRDKAKAGRMNSAGIPHFYGAFDEQTALREVAQANSNSDFKVVLGTFEIAKNVLVLDLTEKVPPPPSNFDDQAQPLEDSEYFLAMFARDISLPVSQDGSEHIEYAPTQIVSEYLAQVFSPNGPDSPGLDGVIYRSAVNPAGKNLVLFPGIHPSRKRQFESCVRFADWRLTRV